MKRRWVATREKFMFLFLAVVGCVMFMSQGGGADAPARIVVKSIDSKIENKPDAPATNRASVATNGRPTREQILARDNGVFAGVQAAKKEKNGIKVAVGVLIHKGFSRYEAHAVSEGMFDNLAVMTSQIARFRPYMAYDVQQVAFLTNASAELAPFMEDLGWETRVVSLKVQPSDIRNPRIAEEIVKDGAIGIWEMLKLEPWRPSVLKMDVEKILIVDTDIHLRQPFDQVFDWVQPGHTFGYTNGAWESEPVNGGFLVVRPGEESEKDYHNIMELLKEGDFRAGNADGGGWGWKGKVGWTYGGRTMQGLLPYYYIHDDRGKTRASLLNRCLVNNMVNSDACKATDPTAILSNHFTGGCYKPWLCNMAPHELCTTFMDQWWKDREMAAAYLGLAPTRRCPMNYEALGLHTASWRLPRGHGQ